MDDSARRPRPHGRNQGRCDAQVRKAHRIGEHDGETERFLRGTISEIRHAQASRLNVRP